MPPKVKIHQKGTAVSCLRIPGLHYLLLFLIPLCLISQFTWYLRQVAVVSVSTKNYANRFLSPAFLLCQAPVDQRFLICSINKDLLRQRMCIRACNAVKTFKVNAPDEFVYVLGVIALSFGHALVSCKGFVCES